MKKKLLLVFLAAIMGVSSLTGCGKKEGGNTAASASAGNAKTEAKSSKSGDSLRFLDVSPSETRQRYYEETFKKFKEETGISVTYESVPWDDAADKITVLGASHQLPDVMTTWSGWLGQYTQAGWVIPLSDYIGETRSEYTEAVNKLLWKSEEERYGKIYTVPDGIMVKGVFVRKDWAEEADIKLDPQAGWTYDDYFSLVAKLTDSTQKRYGVSYRGARGALDPLLTYLQGFTGGNTYDAEGNILINSPECQEAFKKWTDIYLNGYAPEDSINWGFTEMVDNFTGGLTGTLINDSEVAATCLANMEASQWMVMPMPKSTVDNKIYNTINAPYSYSISGDCKNPDNAWKLIEFMNRPNNNIEYCKLTGLIPIKKDVENDPTYGLDGPYATFVQQLNDPNLAVPTTFGPFDYTDLHQGMFHEEIQKYLLGKEDANKALSTITDELQTRMKKYLADNPDAKIETASVLSK
ncbi:MAG: sugar transporter substrate-binding protein [Clostridia bacterium]|jgi:multiple sugar transport system substrate-binding protein|nr:sugar transporter substrate-binding protein [Clostridia bacterium]